MPRARVLLISLVVLACVVSPTRAGFIEGYTDEMSYRPGDPVRFHVSTSAQTFDVEFLRVGWTPQLMGTVTGIPGRWQPTPWTMENQAWRGPDWDLTFTWVVPDDWPTGSYLARFVSDTGDVRYRSFVVRPLEPGSRSRLAFVANYNTSNAYDIWGGASLYHSSVLPDDRADRVSFRRPWSFDHGKGVLFVLQEPLIGQLEADGFRPEYLTEQDIHRNPSLLGAYDVVVLAGHHEYISRPIYDALEQYHARGGHLAFFSANDISWQVRYEDDCQTLVCYKDLGPPYDDPMYGVNDDLLTTHWYDPPLNRPSEALQGIRYVERSLLYDGVDFIVQDASHWIFAGTGLQTGDALGVLMARSETDFLNTASPAVMDIVLHAVRPYSGTEPGWAPTLEAAAIFYADNAEYGLPTGRGGQVFSSGSEGSWSHEMRDTRPHHQVVRAVTRNIIQHMVDSPRDCNTNGVDDAVDIANCPADSAACADCNGDGVPDGCNLLNCPDGSRSCDDCNANGVLDACDIDSCLPGDDLCGDCNGNRVPDVCDLAACPPGMSTCADCNTNGILDVCDIDGCPGGEPACGDCDLNAVPDACDLRMCAPGDPFCTDCDHDGIPDGCQADCDADGISDACDLANCPPGDGACADCNSNGVPDGCEADRDLDGLIDDCDPDQDNDGVANAIDLCDDSSLALSVRPDGTAHGDMDVDCDVDLCDFAHLQICFTGAGGIAPMPLCERATIDADADVDLDDFNLFVDSITSN